MMTETTVVNVEAAPNNNAAKRGENQPLAGLRMNLDYFKTTPGILKIVELILGILCMALASPALLAATHFFLFVATTAFISALIWSFVYFLGIREALNLPINWIFSELLNTAIFAIFYLIAFCVQLSAWSPIVSHSYYRGINLTAGVFGIFNCLVYGFASYLLYMEWKNSRTS